MYWKVIVFYPIENYTIFSLKIKKCDIRPKNSTGEMVFHYHIQDRWVLHSNLLNGGGVKLDFGPWAVLCDPRLSYLIYVTS